MLETAVRELKQVIVEHDGANAANRAFVGRVEELISGFYDDICEIANVPSQTLFDLFVIKVLYVERSSTDAGVISYLGQLLERHLYATELFPTTSNDHRGLSYISDLLNEAGQRGHVQNWFEAYRTHADNSLFVAGIFRRALGQRRGGLVDRSYYVTSGKRFYHLASRHELAESTRQRALLEKLSTHFEVYREALSEMSERYIMGFDLGLVADKMLDSFNQYRVVGEERHLEDARRYAAILKIQVDAFPGLLRRRPSRGRTAHAQPTH